jgi:nucleoside-diphosphate-sugar epimerase
MRILVTGSEGNIGQVLVPYLKSQGHEVFGIDHQQRFKDGYKTVDINNGADLIGTFFDFNPDIVFHLAAMVSRVTCEASPTTTIKTNLYGTENIIQLCKKVNAKLIFFSTSEVYGNIGGILSEDRTDLQPNNFYGLSKLMGEQLVKYEVTNGLEAIIVRPFMFYHEDETIGDHRSAMIRFATNLVEGSTVQVHKGSIRSWMHLDDAVVVLEDLCYISGFQLLNIGSNVSYPMEKIASAICDILGLEYKEYVEETPLPPRMTLTKIPNVNKQFELTGYLCKVHIDDGIKRVVTKVLGR